ncbi:hypothetical protein [Paracoccus sp. (in: a-proteobacteria)]|uniref:hypothetical protein n=1 Tax=Paracoccus sp. TaxID=267 RepID=UPI0035B1DC29
MAAPTDDTGDKTARGTDGRTDPELLRLELEKKKAAAAADVSANQIKRLETLMPSNVQALAGTTKVSGEDVIECRILAMLAITAVAKKIANKVREAAPNKTVLLHNELDITAVTALCAFDVQLKLVEGNLDRELGQAQRALAAAERDAAPIGELLAGTSGVSIALKAAADLVSLFRVDIEFEYNAWSIADATLAAAVAGALTQNKVSLRNHALMPLGMPTNKSKLLDRIMKVLTKRSELEGVLADLADRAGTLKADAEGLKEEMAKAAAATPPKSADDQQKALEEGQRKLLALEREIVRLQTAGAAFDTFQAALVKADPGALDHPLTRLLRAEALQEADDCVWLALKSVAAGGGYKTKRFLWWPTTKVLYSGGAIVEYVLFDRTGTVLTAGVASDYSGFIEIRSRSDIPSSL